MNIIDIELDDDGDYILYIKIDDFNKLKDSIYKTHPFDCMIFSDGRIFMNYGNNFLVIKSI